MHKDVARAQAETLRTWADEWEREAGRTVGASAERISLSLRRCAALVEQQAGLPITLPVDLDEMPIAPPQVTEMRGD